MKDKQIEKLIKAEEKRQKKVINLIPSENYVSSDVLKALGSIFDNKYAEGYPYARYYGGQENTDKLETLCQGRALKLFGLADKNSLDVAQGNSISASWHVNVQPLSGGPAYVRIVNSQRSILQRKKICRIDCTRIRTTHSLQRKREMCLSVSTRLYN
jgi:glycine hydroxymethyltransferase